MVDRSSSEKKRFIGLMLSGGRSPNTAIAVLDYFRGHGRLFLVESFVGKKEKHTDDLDTLLVEKLRNLTDMNSAVNSDSATDAVGTAEIITNAPLTLPPCFGCNVLKCEGKDQCSVPETIKIMDLYEELKQKRKNLKRFTPYTQRLQDIWVREMVPEVMPPHEAMGSNIAQLTARIIHIKKMMPGTIFKETYPPAGIFRLLPSFGLSSNYLKEYRDIIDGKRIRSTFIRKMEEKTSVFIYDNDIDMLVNNIRLFDSLVLAFVGVLGFLGKTEGPCSDFFIPENNIKF